MAQEQINKAILTAQEFLGTQPVFPSPAGPNPYQITRYRIVSEDKTRVSDWSNFYITTLPSITDIQAATTSFAVFSKSNNVFSTVTLSWTIAEPYSQFYAFDVFARWTKSGHTSIPEAGYQFSGTTTGNSISFSIPKLDGTDVPTDAVFKICLKSIDSIYEYKLEIDSLAVSVT
jgi:hypothetical protein